MEKDRNSKEIAFSIVELLVILTVMALVILVGISAQARINPTSVRITCVNNLRQIAMAFRLWEGDNASRFPQAYAGNPQYPAINSPIGSLGGIAWNTSNGTGAPNVWTVFEVMSNELNNPRLVTCPADNARSPGASNFNNALLTRKNGALSYFVGLAASESSPKMFLAGDRNMCSSTSDSLTSGPPSGGYSPGLGGNFVGYNAIITTNPPALLGWNITEHVSVGNVALADGSVQLFNYATTQPALVNTGDPSGQNFLLFP